jgi:hypothetical protein
MNARTREEEYLRRMKALGYEPDLRGMDDDDIEWELSKMEESDRRREVQLQPQQQPLRTIYRPVDPGLKARILRQFGQPYDESAIPKGQEFYLNGWDNGDDEEEVKTLISQREQRKSGLGNVDFDPWKNVWKLDWGKDGNALAGPRTMEWRPGRDETAKPLLYFSAASEKQAGGDLRDVKEVSDISVGQGSDSTSTQNADIFGQAKNVINVKKFWDEVYQEARDNQKLEHEEAIRKANEAAILYTGYLGTAAVATRVVTSVSPFAGGTTGFLGWANADDAKKWIKGKVFAPYNPVWDGTTSD